ncbi:MAG TPA: hypothetical protein VFA21_20415 [Pyrinomonadaceae bacterium]|nr:hypothetical protein [Pyrinomonadaceae bacterium]
MREGTARIAQLISAACTQCHGSTVIWTMVGPLPCNPCLARKVTPAARLVADCVWMRVEKNQFLDTATVAVAQTLVHATYLQPFSGPALTEYLGLGEREFKGVVETIRRDWHLPLISRRQQRGGYWFAESADQFLAWLRQMRAQAVQELATAHGMMRAHYPLLAGQTNLDFIQGFTQELQEAIR